MKNTIKNGNKSLSHNDLMSHLNVFSYFTKHFIHWQILKYSQSDKTVLT